MSQVSRKASITVQLPNTALEICTMQRQLQGWGFALGASAYVKMSGGYPFRCQDVTVSG